MTHEETASIRSIDNGVSQRPSVNYCAWLGPIVTFVGAVSYFLYFVRFANLRDFPWVNLPLVICGAVLSIIGFGRTFRVSGYGRASRVFAGTAGLLSVALAGLFVWYIYGFSYQMPSADGVVNVSEPAPDFSLPDQNRQVVGLGDFRGRKLVITFYRGYW